MKKILQGINRGTLHTEHNRMNAQREQKSQRANRESERETLTY